MITKDQAGAMHVHRFKDDPFIGAAADGAVPQPRIVAIALHERCGVTADIMGDLIFKLTVNQLATSIRLHGIDEESTAMLGMLESLVIAGEIEFNDFMRRINNLFPQVMEQIDASLLEKLSAYAQDG